MAGNSHRIIDLLDPEVVESAISSAERFKIKRTIHPKDRLELDNIERIEKVIEFHELAAIDYWRFAFDSEQDNREKREVFHNICKRAFSLMEVCPVPEEPIRRIVHVLKMMTYAYLGEKWEDMRRYLRTSGINLEIRLASDSNWDYRLLVNIYRAILYLTGRNSWQDLRKSMDTIDDLRKQQKVFEEGYLDTISAGRQRGAAHQIASLYHLAKSVELASEYMLRGTPADVEEQLDFQFKNAILYSQAVGIVDLEIVLRLLKAALKQMTRNSVWTAAFKINPKITEFVESMTKSEDPVFEFLYPQKMTILEKGLLDPASDAIIVNLPTSSGKTMMAEFKILEVISSFGRAGKIVYVVPTRTLVNQITARLRRELGAKPLGLRIEKASGAVEIDGFEDSLLSGEEDSFDVLVTTPEKLQLLIRNPKSRLAESIVLAIIDEAHNLDDRTRGLSLEVLLSIIKTDCRNSKFLLLTPFIPNGAEIVKWLSPRKSRSIGMELNWKPNDLVVGMCYAEGKRREISTFFKPLFTNRGTIPWDERIKIGHTGGFSESAGKIKITRYKLASLIATQLDSSQNFLILARTVPDTWNTAKLIYENLPDESDIPEEILLVQKFIKSELGENFPLARYLGKRIGVHHAGLPDDIKSLIEWLLEDGHLRTVVATTTIAQGVNFPVSGILVSSYTYPETGSSSNMPNRDFWNLLGRAGRMNQPTLGLVGIMASKNVEDDTDKAAKYLRTNIDEVTSVLVRMVTDALALNTDLDLSKLAGEHPNWSHFVQYIAHMKNQSESLGRFIAESDLILGQTYGYGRLDSEKQGKLLSAVKSYAEKLDGEKYESYLSDLTGFAPESIEKAMNSVTRLGMGEADWNSESLFSPASDKLATLVGIMLYSIPEVKGLSEAMASGQAVQQKTIGLIISDWVSGKGIEEIATKYFGREKDPITACVKAIYGKIVNLATWGLAGIQKIPASGLELEGMTTAQKRRIANLPAMIYYGVDSEAAILMRMNGVPRSISRKIGHAYMAKNGGQDLYSRRTTDVLDWLDRLPEEMWQPESKAISGPECKRIWRRLSGT